MLDEHQTFLTGALAEFSPGKDGDHILSIEISKSIDNLFSFDNFPEWNDPLIRNYSEDNHTRGLNVSREIEENGHMNSLNIYATFTGNNLRNLLFKYYVPQCTISENVSGDNSQSLQFEINLKNGAVLGWRTLGVSIRKELPDLGIVFTLESAYDELGESTYSLSKGSLHAEALNSEVDSRIKVPKQLAHKAVFAIIKQLVHQVKNGEKNLEYEAEISQAFKNLEEIADVT